MSVCVRDLSPEGVVKILSKSFERVAEFRCLGTLLKITNVRLRRIHCHEKNNSDIAASQRQVRPVRLGSNLEERGGHKMRQSEIS